MDIATSHYTTVAQSNCDFILIVPPDLGREYATAAPQKDHLCGAFWGAIALRTAGITRIGDEPVDQDFVALECGATLEDGDPYLSLPPGAEPRIDYRLLVPTNAEAARSGTSARALRRAIDRLGESRIRAIPIRTDWTADRVTELFELVRPYPSSHLIVNWQTARLWSAATSPNQLLAYLSGEEPSGEPAEWRVGHFAALTFAFRLNDRSIIGVLDTYPSLGRDGHHFQPASAVADALNRGDGQEGGVLCVTAIEHAPPLSDSLTRAKFSLHDWDNGSDPRD